MYNILINTIFFLMNWISSAPFWLLSLDAPSLLLSLILILGSYAIYPTVPYEECQSPSNLLFEILPDRAAQLKSHFRLFVLLLGAAFSIVTAGSSSPEFQLTMIFYCTVISYSISLLAHDMSSDDPNDTIALFVPLFFFGLMFYGGIGWMLLVLIIFLYAIHHASPFLLRPREKFILSALLIVSIQTQSDLIVNLLSLFAWGSYFCGRLILSMGASESNPHHWSLIFILLDPIFAAIHALLAQECQLVWSAMMLLAASMLLPPTSFLIFARIVHNISLGFNVFIFIAFMKQLFQHLHYLWENRDTSIPIDKAPHHVDILLQEILQANRLKELVDHANIQEPPEIALTNCRHN